MGGSSRWTDEVSLGTKQSVGSIFLGSECVFVQMDCKFLKVVKFYPFFL